MTALRRLFRLGPVLALALGSAGWNPAQGAPGFHRVPITNAPRSLVLDLDEGLNAAIDLDRMALRSLWRDGGLKLQGPAHGGPKIPFWCEPHGTVAWNTGGGGEAEARFTALQVLPDGFRLEFLWSSPSHSGARVSETFRGRRLGERSLLQRAWQAQPPAPGLRFRAAGSNAVVEGLGWAWRVLDADRYALVMARGAQLLRSWEGHWDLQWPPGAAGGTSTWCFAASAELLPTTPADFQGAGPSWIGGSPGSPGPAPRVSGRPVGAMPQPAQNGGWFIEPLALPSEWRVQVTGMDWLPNGDLAVCTWAGDVFMAHGARGDAASVSWSRFAGGLLEPLGLVVVDGRILVSEKSELTRLIDLDGNGTADRFECVASGWPFTGDYHDFTFGPVVEPDGSFILFRDGQRGRWDVDYMSWAIRVREGSAEIEPLGSGFRVANGWLRYGPSRDVFVADNQGNWIGACKLNHLQKGEFYGFPAASPGPRELYGKPRPFTPPAVWFPRSLSPSTSGMVEIPDNRFGPFEGQVLAGDFQNSVVNRVVLERVAGQWQGMVIPFLRGFRSGVNRLVFDPQGRLYAGGLKNRAWPAFGPEESALDRVRFQGPIPFTIHSLRARADGFDLRFTDRPDAAEAVDSGNYQVAQFGYQYHEAYGSAEYDRDGKANQATPLTIRRVELLPDRASVRLIVDGLAEGFVTRVQAALDSVDGRALEPDIAFYTLNRLPAPGAQP